MALIQAAKPVHVRCNFERCRKRAVFRQHPDMYITPRVCEGCGGTKFRVIENRTKDRGAKLCNCAGRVFGDVKAGEHSAELVHRRGSPNCYFRKDGTPRYPGDADFSDPDYDPDHDANRTEQEDSIPEG